MGNIASKAQELITARLAALEPLETAMIEIEDAKKRLHDAEASLASAWKAATDAGWTTGELRRLGVAEPAARRGGRPRGTTRTRRAGGTPTAETPSQSAAPDSPDAAA